MGWERKKHQILGTTSESDVVVDVVVDDRIGAVDHDSQTSQVKSFVQQSCPFWLWRCWCCVGRFVAPATVFVSSSVVPSVSASASPVTILLKFNQITISGLFQNKGFCRQKNWNDLDPKVLKEKMLYRNIGVGWIRCSPFIFCILFKPSFTQMFNWSIWSNSVSSMFVQTVLNHCMLPTNLN
jgi:hypothetical protein